MSDITVRQVLEARDSRVTAQYTISSLFPGTLVCLTIVMPGPVKNSALSERLFVKAVLEFGKKFRDVLLTILRDTVAGPEAYFVVRQGYLSVKERTCRLEQSFPYGRLWDFDVLDEKGIPIARTAVGFPERACIVCGRTGAGCARSRMHSLEDLESAVFMLSSSLEES